MIPLELPLSKDSLELELWDSDNLVDEHACTLILNLKTMLNYDRSNPNLAKKTQIRWVNMYGPPIGYMGPNSEKMKKDPLSATHWAGRVLIEFFVDSVKYPIYKVIDIPK